MRIVEVLKRVIDDCLQLASMGIHGAIGHGAQMTQECASGVLGICSNVCLRIQVQGHELGERDCYMELVPIYQIICDDCEVGFLLHE